MSNGILLTTPSISGDMFVVPTPAAFSPIDSIGPTMPFHENNQSNGLPIFATPLGTPFLLV